MKIAKAAIVTHALSISLVNAIPYLPEPKQIVTDSVYHKQCRRLFKKTIEIKTIPFHNNNT